MKYMGSKNRIANHIIPIMWKEVEEKNLTAWVEPFVGGANIIDKVPNTIKRVGIDINPHTIAALKAIRDFPQDLPTEVTEEYYKSLKGTPPDPITSWVRFVCSFGGKFEDGFARENPQSKAALKRGKVRNFAQEGYNNAQKQSPKLQGVILVCEPYNEYSLLEDCLIYCDIPYQNSTTYKTEDFNHEEFWKWARKMSEKNSVFVSEYSAPDDFECVWEGEVKTNFASQRSKATHKATEKLFKMKE